MTESKVSAACRICGNGSGNREHLAREMMFGLREEFRYIECSGCGCLGILDPPADPSPYYPDDYYAMKPPPRQSRVKRFLKRRLAAYGLRGTDLVGRLLAWRLGIPREVEWLRRAGVDYHDAILDVGCGAGHLLLHLHALGFSNLTGIDPYLPADSAPEPGVRLLKARIGDLAGSYDLVMLHHALEHVPDPRSVLEHVHRLLRPGRYALIRTPVAGSHAWRTYGTDWVQLDAPRHLVLFTEDGLRNLAERVGFSLEHIAYDSTGFQFWGSEQYRRDVPLMDDRSVAVNPDNSMFSPTQLRDFEARAAALNARRDGDQACFFLKHAGRGSGVPDSAHWR
ncbi:MAG TPA: class I SAM-dependent methyltransferase [Longimicrobiales bacterium]